MLTVINLIDNSEMSITHRDVKVLKLSDIWLKVIDPTEDELKALSKKLDVSINLIKPIEIPTFSTTHLRENIFILYLSSISKEFSLKDVSKTAVVLGKGFIITISVQDIPAYESAKSRLHKTKTDTEIFLFNNLVDAIVKNYATYIDAVDERIAYLESKIITTSLKEKEVETALTDIFDLKTKLGTFARLMWYERSAVNSLKRSELPFLTKTANVYLEEAMSELTKQVETIHTQMARLSDIVYEYEAKSTRTLNVRIERLTDIMKKLTAITVILSIPLVISGHFGMNFKFMPELNEPIAYPISIAVSIGVSLFALFMFRKKGWI